jgi:hypothetical protein
MNLDDLSDESGRHFYRKLDDETDLKLNKMTMAMEMWREARRRAESEIFLVWSEEHGAWWRSGGAGYTHSMEQAGRYTKAQAEAIVASGNKEIHPDTGFYGDRTFNEIAIPDPLRK